MEQREPARLKPHVNVGTIGHVDNGKTTLTTAITKVLALPAQSGWPTYDQIDNAPEEVARGLKVSISRVEYETEKRHYSHIDCPGHADYVQALMAGAVEMDGAILVVSAIDGLMPQTHEHVRLVHAVQVPAVVVFLNKVDMMDDPYLLDQLELETRELLSQHRFPGDRTCIVRGSALRAVESRSLEPDAPEYAPIRELLRAIDDDVPIRQVTGNVERP